MTMTQDAAYKIAYPEGYMGGKHNLGMSVLKQLPYQIENPVAILKSNTQPSSIVLLTAWKDGDKSIIVPLHLDKQGAISVENRIASAYQTGHMQTILEKRTAMCSTQKTTRTSISFFPMGYNSPRRWLMTSSLRTIYHRQKQKATGIFSLRFCLGRNGRIWMP